MKNEWLLFVYRVPTEPSRHRVQIWRKIKAIGAVFLQNSVCVLPATRSHEQEFRKLRQYVVDECGGQAYVFLSQYLGPPGVLESVFNQARDEEYAEIIHRCEEFLQELEEETRSSHFTFAELEENEEDLAKLENWYRKVKKRDILHASLGPKAEQMLAACRESLALFSNRVFAADDGRIELNSDEKGALSPSQDDTDRE
jgi:hypothetical protein